MSKEIDELLKNRPEIKSQVQQATKQLDTQTMPSQGIEGNPRPRAQDTPNKDAIQGSTAPGDKAVSWHDSQSMENKYYPDSKTPSQSNEVDKALSERGKIESQETGKELNQQHQVSANKDQDLER